LFAQGLHGIDSGGASRRHITSKESGSQQHCSYRAERGSIDGSHFIPHAAHGPADEKSSAKTQRQPFPLFQVLELEAAGPWRSNSVSKLVVPFFSDQMEFCGRRGVMRNRVPLGFKEQGEVQKHQNIFLPRTLDCSVRG